MDGVKVFDSAHTQSEIVINAIPVPIPEPSSSALLGLAGILLVLRRRK